MAKKRAFQGNQRTSRALKKSKQMISKHLADLRNIIKNTKIDDEAILTIEQNIQDLVESREKIMLLALQEKLKFLNKQTEILVEDLKSTDLQKELIDPGTLLHLNRTPFNKKTTKK